MEQKKLSNAEKVSKKMALAKYIHELYYQNASLFMSDPRYAKLPAYLQTSGISSTFIALKEALDKDRENRITPDKIAEIANSYVSNVGESVYKQA